MSKVRTRFAPSPTGYLHVGGVRTALFAWLVAKQAGGDFILRIEDTDKAREVTGAKQHIIDSLKWVGLNWHEGPDIGGQFAPYCQSERLDTYKTWGQKLVDAGKAYADPYSQKQLDEFRQQAKKQNKPFLFRDHRPNNPPKWDGSQPLRLKAEPKVYKWNDLVMGSLTSGPEVIDDFILIKADGYPTYNFGHIIDDYLMQVSHIIRGQEFISSVPKYLSLYEALGFEPPKMAHLPYVMAKEGNRKLSKRDGAKDILAYAKEGLLPEAMINFLATLGWNDGTEQELFSEAELIKKFSLSRVQHAGARFDETRLYWMNGAWIRKLAINDLCTRSQNFWPASANTASKDYKKQVLQLCQDRLKTLSQLKDIASFFFEEPKPNLELIHNNKTLNNLGKAALSQLLDTAIQHLKTSDFTTQVLTKTLNDLLVITKQSPSVLFSLIRTATTWASFSPDLVASLSILGKEQTIKRLQTATEVINRS